MRTRFLLLLACMLFGGYANAALITLDFESDTIGSKGSSFTSVDSNLVTFSAEDSVQVDDFFNQSIGQGLAAFGIDSGLTMDFSVFVDSLSLVFGNDDPNFVETKAVLTVFSGAMQVGQTELIYNKNDAADETISIAGVGNFNRATLVYEDGTSALAEVVDNVTFNTTDIPEPSSLLLATLGIIGLRVKRKRQK